jgi:hypothetical protein
MMTWYLTLKQGAALAKRRVRTVRIAVLRSTVGSEEWQSGVVEGGQLLAEEVMPALAEGWSRGALVFCVVIWLYAVGFFSFGLTYKSTGAVVNFELVLGLLLACIPAGLLFDVADASTECDMLMKDLNDKRLLDLRVTTHTEVKMVEDALNKLNKVPRCSTSQPCYGLYR